VVGKPGDENVDQSLALAAVGYQRRCGRRLGNDGRANLKDRQLRQG
jgi:hypothetical protein